MIRWSPISSVFSIEPEGITRACPSVPLINRNARITQNQAITSLFTRALIGTAASFASSFFVFIFTASAFTFHRHFFLEFRGAISFFHFQLHQVRRVHARVTRRAEFSFGVIPRLPQSP